LEVFVQKLTCAASTLTDDDITELHRAHYTDDQIFEAIVSAAVGAGLFRLNGVQKLLREGLADAISEARPWV
jgi:alkylhydroperoxidase family enzyme